jgi:hypothetical protein
MTDELQPTPRELRLEREREMDEIERGLIEMIERIADDYRRAAAPYVRQLAELRAVRLRIMVMPDGMVEVPFTSAPQDRA